MSTAKKIEKGKKVRYAVVGGGWISQDAFMPGVAQTSNSEMTALFTSDEEKFKVAENYKMKSYKYEDYAKALDEDVFDAVYIATPNWRHKEFAVPALEKGIHVFLEKPMEINEDLCKDIIAAAKKTGAKLGIAYRLHCEEATVNIINQVRTGKLGDPRMYVSAFSQKLKKTNHRSKNGFDAGPVPDMGVYQINSCRNLFGMEPIEASAIGFKFPGVEMDFHDTVSITLRFPGDRVAQFTTSYTSASINEYSIVGTKGELTAKPAFGFGEGVKLGYESEIDGESESKKFDCVDQFSGQTDYFSQCIIDDVEPEFNGEEGLRDVRVVIAIKRSIETGKPVKLEHLEPRTVHPNEKQVRKFKQAKRQFPMINCEDPAEK